MRSFPHWLRTVFPAKPETVSRPEGIESGTVAIAQIVAIVVSSHWDDPVALRAMVDDLVCAKTLRQVAERLDLDPSVSIKETLQIVKEVYGHET